MLTGFSVFKTDRDRANGRFPEMSGRQSFQYPLFSDLPVLYSVVQTMNPPLPEFNPVWPEQVPTPVGWAMWETSIQVEHNSFTH